MTELVRDFSQCNARLWDDKLGQISLATTTLFWGASANLRYLVLAWAGAALAYDTPRATVLLLLVGLGTAAGAVVASATVRLVSATNVILLGAALGRRSSPSTACTASGSPGRSSSCWGRSVGSWSCR